MIALDTNVLVYAQQGSDQLGRHSAAFDIIAQSALTGAVVPLQVLGEFINVCRSKLGSAPQDAIGQVEDYLGVFDCQGTTPADLMDATYLAERFRIQYFDALIATVARRAGATVLLSEDMHDGLDLDGIRVINPFIPANSAALAALFAQD